MAATSGKYRRINNLPERVLVGNLARMASAGKFPQMAVGIGDDAAVLAVPRGHEIVVTTDFSLEGTHFRRDWHSAGSAGQRCLARGLSDLAAMGAEPVAAFLSLAVPAGTGRRWMDGFFRGLLALATEHGIPLAGGDLARSPGRSGDARILADIVLVGSVPAGRALLRSSASAGDAIYVTGRLGGAAAELERLARGNRESKILRRLTEPRPGAEHPHLFPQPRIAAGIALRKLNARVACHIACMDISDGLAIDLDRLCEASGVAAELAAAQIPLAPGTTLEQALYGGEDYELLFTAAAKAKIPRRIGGVAVTRIGRVASVPASPRAGKPASRISLVQKNGSAAPLKPKGWEYQL